MNPEKPDSCALESSGYAIATSARSRLYWRGRSVPTPCTQRRCTGTVRENAQPPTVKQSCKESNGVGLSSQPRIPGAISRSSLTRVTRRLEPFARWRAAAAPPRTRRHQRPPTHSDSPPARPSGSTRRNRTVSRTRRLNPVPSAPSTMALGSVQSIASYDCVASPARPTVQTFSDFNSSIARAMFTTSTIGTCAPPPPTPLRRRRRAPRRAASGGRRRARRRHRRCGRWPDVVRVLDAVQHDEQRRSDVSRTRSSTLRSRAASPRRRSPWCTPWRLARSSVSWIHPIDRHPRDAASVSTCCRRPSSPGTDLRRATRPAFKRLEDGIDAVNDHPSCPS